MLFKFLVIMVLFAVPIIPTFWAILDIPKRRFATQRQKMAWLFLVATLPCVGAIVYILFCRRHTEPLETS
ncbi:MAG: hypothetical protein GX422_14900 [Deltaproteobacteria bacterium]|nr:hypothetical protein [Deltaproteobacteria bacterium]